MRFGAVAAVVAGVAWCCSARADDPSAGGSKSDVMAAEILFSEARAAMREGRFVEACPKLEGSLRLERAVGTMLNLADCYQQTRRPASAWFWFREGAAQAAKEGQRERATYARERAQDLEPALCRLAVRGGTAAVPADVIVRRDGVVVERAAWDVPVPVDPGPHTVAASGASGRVPFRVEVVVVAPSEGPCPPTFVDLPYFPALSLPPAKPSAVEAVPPVLVPSHRWSTPHTLAVVAGSLGLVGLGVGIGFGVRAIAQKSDGDAGCTDLGCTQEARATTRDAGVSADIATATFVASAAFLAIGTVLWVVAPSLRTRVAGRGALVDF